MKVVIAAIEASDHNNVWEIEQPRDSLETHRIRHLFRGFYLETKHYQKVSNPVYFPLSAPPPSI